MMHATLNYVQYNACMAMQAIYNECMTYALFTMNAWHMQTKEECITMHVRKDA